MPSVLALLLPSIITADERAFALPIRIVVVSRINNARQDNYGNTEFSTYVSLE